jgi:hypothetical protein
MEPKRPADHLAQRSRNRILKKITTEGTETRRREERILSLESRKGRNG